MRSLLQYFVCVLSGQVFDVGVEVSFGVGGGCGCVGGGGGYPLHLFNR